MQIKRPTTRRCRLNEEESRRSLDRQLHVYATNAALQGWEQHNLTRVEALLRQCARAARGGDPREFPWYYLWKGLNRIRETPAIPVADFAWTLAFSPDGKRLAAAHPRGGFVSIWDVNSPDYRLVARFGTEDWSEWYRARVFLSEWQHYRILRSESTCRATLSP